MTILDTLRAIAEVERALDDEYSAALDACPEQYRFLLATPKAPRPLEQITEDERPKPRVFQRNTAGTRKAQRKQS